MKLTTEEIERRLAATTDVQEEMFLLLRLSDLITRNHPRQAIQYAQRVVHLASIHNHKENQAHGWRLAGVSLFLLGEYREALSLLHSALAIFERVGDESMSAKTRHYIAAIAVSTGEHGNALELFERGLATFKKLGDTNWIITTRNYISHVYEQTGEVDKAIRSYLDTLELVRSLDDTSHLGKSLYNVAVLYGRIGNYDKALECANASFDIWTGLNDSRGMGFVLQLTAQCYVYMGRSEEAENIILRAEKLLRTLGAKDNLADMQICRGRIALEKARDARAMSHFRRAFRMAVRTGNKNMAVTSLGFMGKTCMYRGQYRSALKFYVRAEKDVAAVADRQTHYQLYEDLATAYEALGEMGDALRYRTWYMKLREQVLGADKLRTVTELSMQAERKSIEHERELYRQKVEHLEQEVARITKNLTETGLHLLQKNEAIRHIAQQLQSIAGSEISGQGTILKPLLQQMKEYGGTEEEWNIFEKQFELRYAEYSAKLLRHCPSLSSMERKVCTLLMLNLLSKEIASVLCISPRTVDRHRYNIRKKMNVPFDVNLVTFLSLLK